MAANAWERDSPSSGGTVAVPGAEGDGWFYDYKQNRGSEGSILQQISDICISMKAEDYLQLPDIIYHEIPVVLDPKAQKAYADLERKMILELPDDEEDISVTSAAALSNKLLQLANGALYDDNHQAHEIHNARDRGFHGAGRKPQESRHWCFTISNA